MNNYNKALLNLFNQEFLYNNTENSMNYLLKNKKLIIYGAGSGFITFLSFIINRFNVTVHTILDKKFTSNTTYFNIPAFSPLEYKPTEEEKKEALVIITVGKKEFHAEIFESLYKLGFTNVILSSDIYEYNLPFPLPELEEEGFNFYLKNKEKIFKCFDLFKDNLSKEVYLSFLQTHMQRKPVYIPNCPIEEQYFPDDIVLHKGYSRFINCGAYHGDTIKRLNDLYGKVDSLVAFEPDPDNFESLTRYLQDKNQELAENIIAFPLAVFSDEKQFCFSSGNMTNSAISEKGDINIQCVAIDHVIPSFKPTCITTDIEGAESEAIKGAEALIKDSKPDLAVCVYHSPNHIWEIPLYIDSLKLGYNLYLRNYTSHTSETVLYATTKN